MEPTWQSPDSWIKDGASISGISSLKKGAWTSILKATETHNGKTSEVVIKTFTVPEQVLDDTQRIEREREKFFAAARLQYDLTQGGAKAWVKILRLSDDPNNPSFSMEKCGPSLKDLYDNKVQLPAKDLYALLHALLQALIELKDRHKRSHGNIKPSDVLCALPNDNPPYKLADPSAKGEEHSANDLYSVGLVIYQMVEHREWDPLQPITPTRAWSRFGSKRDRWVAYLTMLLNPNGCHEPLPDVKKEAVRLKPTSPMRYPAIAALAICLVVAGAVGYHFLIGRHNNTTVAATNASGGGGTVAGGGGGGGGSTQPTLDPQTKAAYEAAKQAYTDARNKYQAAPNTPRYDHTKSRAVSRSIRDLLPDQITSSAPEAFRNAAEGYRQATAKLTEAMTLLAAEEEAGQQADAAVFADLTQAQNDFKEAKARWDYTASKFVPARDHTRSRAMADAARPPAAPAAGDPIAARVAAEAFRAAAARLVEAVAMVKEEDASGASQDEARAAYDAARRSYQQAREQFTTAEQSVAPGIDLTSARAMAQEAKELLPDQIVLTDAASYRTTTDLYLKAAQKLQQAIAFVDQQRGVASANQLEITESVKNANQALQDKKYEEALALYRKAAELGSAPAMRNVGLLFEIGQGTTKDYGQAALWYRRAADLGNAGAMFDLAYLYETGRGLEKDYSVAAAWYKKAAAGKNIPAMNHLGYFYENGWGMPQDFAEAMKWYRLAADANDPTATGNIGIMYDRGRGMRADPVEAMKWYRKAADLGSASAMNDIGALYDAGRGIKADFKEAMLWYQKSAAKNYAPAMCNIGVLYDNGLGVVADHIEALKWFKKAADLNHGTALFNLGFMHETGRGTPKSLVEAVNWYRKAVKSTDAEARQLAAKALDRLGYAHQ